MIFTDSSDHAWVMISTGQLRDRTALQDWIRNNMFFKCPITFHGIVMESCKQCLRIKRIPQRKIGITFCVVIRFWCPIAEMKATAMPLHMLLDLNKNIYFSKSYSRKLFVVVFQQLDFQKIFFRKNNFEKWQFLIFREKHFEIFFLEFFFENIRFWCFQKNKIFEKIFFRDRKFLQIWKIFEKVIFLKIIFFQNYFSEKYFMKIELSFFITKSFRL